VEDQLVAGDGTPEVGFEGQPAGGRIGGGGVEDDEGAASGVFGAVEGDVGRPQQLVGSRTVGVAGGDADAGTGVDLAALDEDGLGDGVCCFGRGIFQQDRELIAAETGQGVGLTQATGETLAAGDQQPPAGSLSALILNGMNSIDFAVVTRAG